MNRTAEFQSLVARHSPALAAATKNVTSQHKSPFNGAARSIADSLSTLAASLRSSVSAYVAVRSGMTADERTQFDDLVTRTVAAIKAQIAAVQNDVTVQANNADDDDGSVADNDSQRHERCIIAVLGDTLKTIADTYKRMKDARRDNVNAVDAMKRFTPADDEYEWHKKANEQERTTNSQPPADELAEAKHSASVSSDEHTFTAATPSSSALPKVDHLQAQEFADENAALIERYSDLVSRAHATESIIAEIGSMFAASVQLLASQSETVDHIFDDTVNATVNVESGIEQLRHAMKRGVNFRFMVIFAILILAFSLIFLDWFYA